MRVRVRTILNAAFADEHLPWYHRLELAVDERDSVPPIGTKVYVYVSPSAPHAGGIFSLVRLPTMSARGITNGQHPA